MRETKNAVWLLKTGGPQTIAVLAHKMGLTKEGARFQLLKLSREGLVEARDDVRGRGRPQQIWQLTASGDASFPDSHGDLTVRLIDSIKKTLGAPALEQVIAAHSKDALTRYAHGLGSAEHLEDKLSVLAEMRTQEGYMAEYSKEDHQYLFVEQHCPICAAARACQSFCTQELELFRTLMGEEVSVERTSHILAGAGRCAYLIQPRHR